MRFARSQSAVVLAAVAYLAASALGGLLHSHHHGLSHSDSAACGLNHDGHTSPADQSPADENNSPTPLTDDDCLACRLAAQSGLVYLPTPEAGLCPLVVELRSAPPIFFVESVQSCGLARAPPIA